MSKKSTKKITSAAQTIGKFHARFLGTRIPVVQQLLLLGVVLLLIFGSAFTSLLFTNDTEDLEPVRTPSTTVVSETREHAVSADASFEEVAIVAKAAYVWDVNAQRVLYKKNESDVLPIASVAKLMTALVAQEILTDSDKVLIDQTAIMQDGDSGFTAGESFDRLTLSDFMLMSSSNDGAFAMASAAGALLSDVNGAESFVKAMNVRAEELELYDLHFRNPTGLDISTQESGAYGSARDVTFLMEYIVQNYPDMLTYTQEDSAQVYSATGQYYSAENTNHYISMIPNLIGSKTGYTDLAGGNLVVAFDAGLGRPIIVSVLGSTHQDRFTDVIALVHAAQDYVANEHE